MVKARIYRSAQREFICKTEEGDFINARAIGNLLKDPNGIVIGDYVEIEQTCSKEDIYSIVALHPRRSEIFRISVREASKKTTAANIDLFAIVVSASLPEYKRGIVDRFLVRASQWQIKPILIFNKMDQYQNNFDIEFEADRLKSLGVESYEISALDNDYHLKYLSLGVENLKNNLLKKTVIFFGQSGVGKSSLISKLTNNQINLKTQDLGKVGKGMHTTTWSEIVECDNFYLVDSPGIRSLSLEDLGGENLIEYFPDLEQIATGCKFRKCNHDEGSQGCAFYGDFLNELDRKLIVSRLESFKRISEDLTGVKTWNKRIE